MKLGYVILYVENVAETLAFYKAAFGFEQKMLHESGDYGELVSGATTLAFAERKMIENMLKKPAEPNPNAPSFELDFTTEDVAGAVAKAVSAGAQLVQKPEDTPWGQTVAYVTDNSGFLIEICTPVPT